MLIRPIVVNVKFEEFDIYIGRDMPRYRLRNQGFGNDLFRGRLERGDEAGREYRIRAFEDYARRNRVLLGRLHELTGKRLGCWCRPATCHGDVLVKLWEEFVLRKAA